MRNYKVFSAMMLSLIMAFTIFPCTAFAATGAGVSDDGPAVMEYEPGQLIIVTERGTKKKEINCLISIYTLLLDIDLYPHFTLLKILT